MWEGRSYYYTPEQITIFTNFVIMDIKWVDI